MLNYQLTKKECHGCPHKLNARDRLKLQKAFRNGFRFEGKKPIWINRPKDGAIDDYEKERSRGIFQRWTINKKRLSET